MFCSPKQEKKHQEKARVIVLRCVFDRLGAPNFIPACATIICLICCVCSTPDPVDSHCAPQGLCPSMAYSTVSLVFDRLTFGFHRVRVSQIGTFFERFAKRGRGWHCPIKVRCAGQREVDHGSMVVLRSCSLCHGSCFVICVFVHGRCGLLEVVASCDHANGFCSSLCCLGGFVFQLLDGAPVDWFSN